MVDRPSRQRLDLRRRAELDEVEGRRPLGSTGDERELAVEAHAHLARRRAQDRRRGALLAQQPRRADERVAGERQLDCRGEDPQLGALDVVDEDRLGETQVLGHRLALGVADVTAVEKDPELVAAAAVGRAEDPQDVQLGGVCHR